MLDFPGSSCLKSAETFFLSHLRTYMPYIRITSPTALVSLDIDCRFKLWIVFSDRTMDSKVETARKARFPFLTFFYCSMHGICNIWDDRILRFRTIHQLLSRREICHKFYTTRFSGRKFYTLKVRELRLSLLKRKQRKYINLEAFL